MARNIQTNSQTISKVKVWIFSCKSDVKKYSTCLGGLVKLENNPEQLGLARPHPPIPLSILLKK